MVQTRSSQKTDSPVTDLPYRKRRADDVDTPSSSAKKSKRSTPRPKLPLRPPTQDEIVVAAPDEDTSAGAGEADNGDTSIYETPATHHGGSVYATPATNLNRKLNGSINDPTPSQSRGKPISRGLAEHDVADAADQKVGVTSTARRIRFASEEQQDDQETSQPVEHERVSEIHSSEASDVVDNAAEDDSSDDAPEEVTTEAAARSARKAQAGANQAKRAQDLAARDKRRRREHALQEQAQKSSDQNGGARRVKRNDLALANAQDEDASDMEEAGLADADLGADDVSQALPRKLPKYLPQELLTAAPAVRLLQSQSTGATTSPVTAPKTNKIQALTPKQPKDLVRGPVKVRVMADMSSLKHMPPKADPKQGSQRQVRDQWMLGRHGRIGQARERVGSGKMERKSWGANGGFLKHS